MPGEGLNGGFGWDRVSAIGRTSSLVWLLLEYAGKEFRRPICEVGVVALSKLCLQNTMSLHTVLTKILRHLAFFKTSNGQSILDFNDLIRGEDYERVCVSRLILQV